MTLDLIFEVALAALLVLGGLFGLIGSWGLLRLRDAMQRLHAPTKATTIGVGTALLAANMLPMLRGGGFPVEEFLISVFLFVTAPLSALMLAKATIAQGRHDAQLPRPAGQALWANETGSRPEAEPPVPN